MVEASLKRPSPERLIRRARLIAGVETIRIDDGGATLHLLGVCQGLAGEATAVVEALEELQPNVVALALDPELAPQIGELAPSDGLSGEDAAYAEGLSRWGEVMLPPPEFRAAIHVAEQLGAEVVGVDMTEERYLDHYTDTVGVWDLTKRAVRSRWLGVRPIKAGDPSAYCRAFDARLNGGSFQVVERQREGVMADRLAELAQGGTISYVVEVQRLDGVTQALRQRLDRPGEDR